MSQQLVVHPASFASRATAYILDNIFVGFMAGVLIQLVWGAEVQTWAQGYMEAIQAQQQPPLPPAYILLSYVLMFAVYSCWCWVQRGATLGQRILGMRVCHVDSLQTLSFNQAALRFVVLYGVVTIAGPLAVPILALPMINNPKRRALHDLAAGSVVIKSKVELQQASPEDDSGSDNDSREF